VSPFRPYPPEDIGQFQLIPYASIRLSVAALAGFGPLDEGCDDFEEYIGLSAMLDDEPVLISRYTHSAEGTFNVYLREYRSHAYKRDMLRRVLAALSLGEDALTWEQGPIEPGPQTDFTVTLSLPPLMPMALLSALYRTVGYDRAIEGAWVCLSTPTVGGLQTWRLEVHTALEPLEVFRRLDALYALFDFTETRLGVVIKQPGTEEGYGIRVAPVDERKA
jgi:hypothetical protein